MSDGKNNSTMTPSSHYAQLAGREIHWLDWGPANAPSSSPGTAWRAPAATWTNWRSTSRRGASA